MWTSAPRMPQATWLAGEFWSRSPQILKLPRLRNPGASSPLASLLLRAGLPSRGRAGGPGGQFRGDAGVEGSSCGSKRKVLMVAKGTNGQVAQVCPQQEMDIQSRALKHEEQSNGKKEVEEENSFSVSKTSCQANILLKHQGISPWIFSPQDLLAFLQRGWLNLCMMSCGRSVGKGQPVSGSRCPPGEAKPPTGRTDGRRKLEPTGLFVILGHPEPQGQTGRGKECRVLLGGAG